ncbi:MAG: lysophospholipid acyltransferase family protein [Variovorax sp.]|nr:MAG: lysophospholipid acyltransferase family protein [Variovorax sp.]
MTRLFRLLARVPLPWMHRIGAWLGWLVYWLSPTYRRRVKAHAGNAGFTPAQYRPAIGAAGAMVAELPWLWLRPAGESVLQRVRWHDDQVFEQALAARRGVILATPHVGSWEMIGQAIAERFGPAHGPLTVLFRPARKAWLAELIAGSRDRPGLKSLPTNLAGVRGLIRVLRAGGYTGVLPDQVPPQGQGVWAPFFGRPAYTMTLLARLAQQTGAQVLMTWCERLPGARYVIHFEPVDAPALYDAGATPEAAATAMNEALMRLIERLPGQYLWGYGRYKQPRAEL